MSKRVRRTHSPEFKAKVALAAIGGDGSITEIAARFGVHPNLVRSWKKQVIANMEEPFRRSRSDEQEEQVKALQAQVKQLSLETDFLSEALGHDL